MNIPAEANLYEAVRAFILAYAQPALGPDRVFQGRQNRAALPAGSEDYAVMSIEEIQQHGTTLETFSAPDPDPAASGALRLEALLRPAVLLEFFSSGDAGRLRAQRLAIVARSSEGARFFNERGLSALYADKVREHPCKGDAAQFVRRYETRLYLSQWSGIEVPADYFATTRITRLENVNAHHGG